MSLFFLEFAISEHNLHNPKHTTSDIDFICDVYASRASKWTSQELHLAINMVRSGVPVKPAAEQFNIPVMTLWRKTRALGIVSSRAMKSGAPRDAGCRPVKNSKTRYDNNNDPALLLDNCDENGAR